MQKTTYKIGALAFENIRDAAHEYVRLCPEYGPHPDRIVAWDAGAKESRPLTHSEVSEALTFIIRLIRLREVGRV